MWAMVLINNTVRRRKALGLADAMTTVLEHYKTTDTSKQDHFMVLHTMQLCYFQLQGLEWNTF